MDAHHAHHAHRALGQTSLAMVKSGGIRLTLMGAGEVRAWALNSKQRKCGLYRVDLSRWNIIQYESGTPDGTAS